jgi:RNA polymerase sigma-70 factor (ECF subfamily)
MAKTNSIQSIALDFIEKKDNASFAILMKRLKPGLNSYVYKYIKDRDLCNEVLSQTFITIWEKINQYNPKWNFSTWVYAIAKNETLGQIRIKNKTVSHDKMVENHSKVLTNFSPIVSMNIESIGPTGEQLIQDLYDASLNAINNLKEPYRTVIFEREINQKQLQDIADQLSWNLSTVKTRLRKARKDVAETLVKKYPGLVEAYNEEIE